MYTIKAGDLVPPLTVTLTERDGATAVPLGDAESVALRVEYASGTVVDLAMTVVDAAAGQVRRTWEAGDTDEAGTHDAWVIVTWPEGPQTFPARGQIRFAIEDLPAVA